VLLLAGQRLEMLFVGHADDYHDCGDYNDCESGASGEDDCFDCVHHASFPSNAMVSSPAQLAYCECATGAQDALRLQDQDACCYLTSAVRVSGSWLDISGLVLLQMGTGKADP
jgi:hypothetical protein